METLIFCHEVLRNKQGGHIESLRDLYEAVAPEAIDEFEHVRSALGDDDHIKYCMKLATGTGKTWIMQAALVWMHFNKLREKELPPKSASYSYHFLVVAPGLIVLDRLLDALRGKKDDRGNRDPNTRDLNLELFMPDSYRPAFTPRILGPEDINEASEPTEGPFVLVLNWHKIVPREKRASLAREIFGDDEDDKAETYLDYLASYPDMVVFNDEAHHAHDKAKRGGEKDLDAQWLIAVKKLRDKISGRHGRNAGLFLQVDFSATPFYGEGETKEYFAHIVYDYDLKHAMQGYSPVTKQNLATLPLVKQLFVEEREAVGGEQLKTLDFRAIREAESGTKRGKPIALSIGQKLLLQIGLSKLDQIASEFERLKIDKKPVLYVACEETDVADMVFEELAVKRDAKGRTWGDQILVIHSDKKHSVSEEEWEKVRHDLDTIDQPEAKNAKRVVVNVMMLREGFDVRNICVAVVLRSTESDILLEQMVGRGLRLMFNDPTSIEMKADALKDIGEGRKPISLLDFLFVVEHPRFRTFYDNLRSEGYPNFPTGDSSTTKTTGDLERVPVDPARVAKFDLGWPVQIHDEGKLPDPRVVDASKLPKYWATHKNVKEEFGKIRIADVHEPTSRIVDTWGLTTDLFDYDNFLRTVTDHIVLHKDRKTTALSSRRAELMDLIDTYVSQYMFDEPVDFTQEENYRVLVHIPIHDHVVNTIRNAIADLLGKVGYEAQANANWQCVSQIPEILVRAGTAVPTIKCIYPRAAPAPKGGGFEMRFMREILERDGDVEAWSKLEFKHEFVIRYRNEYGILRDYYPDFIVRTKDKMYLVETKADRDMRTATVGRKARAAMGWCEAASRTKPPADLTQPNEWEYVLLSEKTYDNAGRAGFRAVLSAARHELNTILNISQGRLF
jgi:type III restriction enzyme